jgi:hypothetical protein
VLEFVYAKADGGTVGSNDVATVAFPDPLVMEGLGDSGLLQRGKGAKLRDWWWR